ncbi:hypothetical protein E2562_019046 [Oryza meyeriana var. granulata]|uniref:Rieske domain-containing protein n=1 Tax=Oryza meyeriana var. granulata TaxID=110450 RepID=A0A6G1EMW8_9ORYZ|nr:hypothetical protein E2562_019046 [Oryza meyeriana var. granulata]
MDDKLECLYHGWQLDGEGKCVKIPQLPDIAKIPRNTCSRNYEVQDSRDVVWVWMLESNPLDDRKLAWF